MAETRPTDENQATRGHAGLLMLLIGAALIASIAWASLAGEGGTLATLASVVYLLASASLVPALYLIGSIGLGAWAQKRVLPACAHPWAVRLALGLAVMLTLTQLLGMTGLVFYRGVALGVPLLGVLLVLMELRGVDAGSVSLRPNVAWLAAMPALGVLLVASCSPPGWLWASEAGGYDVLSYHLQLVRDWIGMGRVWPVEHNVYSYLPGYMEAAYAQVVVCMGQAGSPTAMIEGGGEALIACQFLHMGISLIASGLVAIVAWECAGVVGMESARRRFGAGVSGALGLATPWVVVTGSMAYNEMAVVALFAGALLVSVQRELSIGRRGLVAGVLVGAACGCKPTALLFAAPVVGLALIWLSDRSHWIRLIGFASLGGLAMLLPWLIRNTIAGGNPVFPQMTGLFGAAHWSAEQASRYAAGHRFEGSFVDALRLTVLPDPADPLAQATGHAVHRGLLHPQWSVLFPTTIAANVVLMVRARTRGVSIFLGVSMLVQLLVWLALTHVQSRFLLPMLVPMSLAIGLAVMSLPMLAARIAGLVVVLVPSVMTAWMYAIEQPRYGGPAAAIVWGAELFTTPATTSTNPRDHAPVPYINAFLPEEARVLLVGNAAPLYIDREMIYATTWDDSVLAQAIREAGSEEPEVVSRAVGERLRELGVTHVYVDQGELARLTRSGWLDPVLADDIVLGILTRLGRKTDVGGQNRHLMYELR